MGNGVTIDSCLGCEPCVGVWGVRFIFFAGHGLVCSVLLCRSYGAGVGAAGGQDSRNFNLTKTPVIIADCNIY